MYINDLVTDFYEPVRTSEHACILVDEKIYLWAGKRDNILRVHCSEEKLQATSYVDVFHCRLGM